MTFWINRRYALPNKGVGYIDNKVIIKGGIMKLKIKITKKERIN